MNIPQIKKITNKLLVAINNFLFPPQCLICHAPILDAGKLCAECFAKCQFITPPFCEKCSLPRSPESFGGDAICFSCEQIPTIAKQIRAVFIYDDWIKPLILRLKYADNLYLADYFAPLMMQNGQEILQNTDLILPVPLHYLKKIWKKYNQAEVLAHAIAKQTQIPWANNILKRKKYQGQKGKNANARMHHLKNAFAINDINLIKDKNICLIDDVVTTKATVNEISQLLLKNGAKSVFVLAIARVQMNALIP